MQDYTGELVASARWSMKKSVNIHSRRLCSLKRKQATGKDKNSPKKLQSVLIYEKGQAYVRVPWLSICNNTGANTQVITATRTSSTLLIRQSLCIQPATLTHSTCPFLGLRACFPGPIDPNYKHPQKRANPEVRNPFFLILSHRRTRTDVVPVLECQIAEHYKY